MKAISILGSPRKKGNNAKLLTTVTETIKEAGPEMESEHLFINNLSITPCKACEKCYTNKGCWIEDDMTELYHKFNQAELIIVASPLYFNTVSSQLKILIDRCQALWGSKFVLNDPILNTAKRRIGTFISTSGQPNTEGRFKHAVATMDLFFKVINADYYDNFFVGNVDENPLHKRPEILEKAKRWGEKIAEELSITTPKS